MDRSTPVAAPVAVEVILCGSVEHGDEGGPRAARPILADLLPQDVHVRAVDVLGIDELLAIPAGAAVVIVDTAVGIPPGQVLELPMSGLIGRDDGLKPRSSVALGFPEVAGVAELIRGRPVRGRIIVMGGSRFGPAGHLSGRVAAAIPNLVATIVEATERMRQVA
jgi:hydrogenase maturation protease